MSTPGTVGGTDDRFTCVVCLNDNTFIMGRSVSRSTERIYCFEVPEIDAPVMQCLVCKTAYLWDEGWQVHYRNRRGESPCG